MTTIPEDIIKQLLPKPPRLLSDGSGYDWREFDRWLQRIAALLGTPKDSQAFNISAAIQELSDAQADVAFLTDNNLEAQALRRMVEQLSTEVNMLTDRQQDVLNLSRKMDDISVELGVS